MMNSISAINEVNEQDETRVGVVPAGTPPPQGIERLELILIKPSKYDDTGYVMRYVRGVLPSNTLATLAGLTEEIVEQGSLGAVQVEVLMMDEFVQKIDPKKLARKYKRPGIHPVVALCGVQTNQFPRAADLARKFKAEGITVMIGGFHVSGAIAMSETGTPPECQSLMDEGVTLVKGEVEDCWGDILRDALHGRLKTFYDIVNKPDISKANIPVVEPRLMKRFAYPHMGTIDAGRGCPFGCSFCTIINVQGRKMRNRLADKIKDRIRKNAALKIDYYFFTDDNFARNPNWREILDAMIDLKTNEGINFQFMMQVDVLAPRIPDFMAKAAEAGCSQVFIGMESINPDNLSAAGKRQNKVEDFRAMIDAWHSHGIACHVGYIIGFPFDTVESVREDVRRLKEEIRVDQASFFMLTPLPGSQDHVEMARRGDWMDPDYNNFDSFHPTTNHPKMTGEEWFGIYKQVWRDFYTVDSMKTILTRANNWTYWGLFKNFVWYKYASIIEDTHPMICGFFRTKDRTDRRPGYAVDSRWTHFRKRTGEIARVLRESIALYFEMQEVWLATRGRTKFQANIDEIKRRYEGMCDMLGESTTRAGQAFSQTVANVRAGAGEVLQKAGDMSRLAAEDLSGRLDRLREQHRPRLSAWSRFVDKVNPFSLNIQTRTHLNAYWRQTWDKLRRGRIFQINPFRLTLNFLSDLKLFILFNLSFFLGYER